MEKLNPTTEFYQALQRAYDHFNEKLFSGSLPNVLFSIQRQANVMGYFSSERWGSNKEKSTTPVCDEISINPDYASRSAIIELFQTLVHEMAHQWQYHHGSPSRRTYHNKEWADKMENIGLMPSSTGKPGGNKTGQKMSDYPISNGLFIKECMTLIDEKFSMPWIDRRAKAIVTDAELVESYNDILPDIKIEGIEALTTTVSSIFDDMIDEQEYELEVEPKPKTYKKRYSCPDCKANVWGKPSLNIGCLNCDVVLVECD